MTAQHAFEDSRMERLEQAALWLQRMRSAGQEERVVESWLDWCQSDPLNQQAFDEMVAIWEISGQLAAVPATVSAPTPVSASVPIRVTSTRRWALAASLAGLGLTAVLGVWLYQPPAPHPVLTREFTTPIGSNLSQTLSDGSVLELGGGTRVTVEMGQKERRINLHEGELFVTVHHDTSRPLWVATNTIAVVATGTAFNVLRTDARTTVTVAEGSVAAFHESRNADAPNVRLQSGQQLIYTHASHSVVVREADPAHAIAWRSGMLYFQNEPLAEVMATINRYTAKSIVVEDPRIREFSFTGTAHINGIESWLAGLTDIFAFPVGVTELADGRRLVAPRPASSD